ncbi:MAG TPA: TIGR01777 family oxidoreductase [Acidimicrobiales bacterium]|nr:TIGR01777 family oxidoreductase [Acidimicrobiales bacterium]
MRVAVTGSHGLIGTALVERLTADGHAVVRLVRNAPSAPDEVRWDPNAGEIDGPSLEGLDAAVHLAGEGVAEKRWSAAQKARILDSRVNGTTTLATALAALAAKPAVLVSGSAIGYYGERGDEVLTEESSRGTGFLSGVCEAWERATAPAEAAGIRVVHIRTGIVLTKRGGALKRQLPLFKLGVGGRLGSGRQWMSWISLDDEVGAIVHAITTPSLSGGVNLTAPNPVTNRDFTKAMGRAVHRPTVLPVPKLGLNLILGSELTGDLLASARIIPAKLTESGYRHVHPTIDDALGAVV